MKKIYVVNIVNSTKERVLWQEQFTTACTKADIKCEYFSSRNCIFIITTGKEIELFCRNQKINPQDSYFFIRSRFQDSTFIYLLATWLKSRNITFNDPANTSHTDAADKVSQMLTLSLHNLPVPDSIICQTKSFELNKATILKNISFPCVLKGTGSKGKAVWKIHSIEELEEKISKQDGLLIIQKYIPNTYDLRVLVFANQVLGAIKRASNDGFYNNVSKGGSAEATTVSETEKELAIEAARVAGIDFAGVDIVRHNNQSYLFEVNKTPQVSGFSGATGINVPEKIVEIIKNQTGN
jgi:RimK family alpha-L-glutamate ligase